MGKTIYVGTFQLGLRNVKLFADTQLNGGRFYFLPDGGGLAEIIVGINDNRWVDVQATLLHEVYEGTMVDQGLRFEKRPTFSDEASNYVFFMTHNELDEAHVRVSWFLDRSLVKFKKVYEKFWREKRKKKKKKCI